MMHFYLAGLFIISLPDVLCCQKIDYLKVRDSLAMLSCGSYDRDINLKAINNLENYDVAILNKNIHLYYEDLAICYWKEARLKDEIFLQKGITANLAALHYKTGSPRALSGLVLSYSALNKCEEAKYYLDKLRTNLPKKKWDEEMDKFVETSCD